VLTASRPVLSEEERQQRLQIVINSELVGCNKFAKTCRLGESGPAHSCHWGQDSINHLNIQSLIEHLYR
jgi:hypothetical protein